MKRARGQGTVELALGLTLLVPVLVLGWAFAEGAFASLKVTEAAESALWDATSEQGGNLPRYAADAQARYADLDGRISTSTGSTGRNGAAAKTTGLQVQCTGTTGVSIRTSTLLTPVLPNPGTVSCSARAETQVFGGFTVPHCSTGRPNGFFGPCTTDKLLALNEGNLRQYGACTVTKNGSPCENGEYWGKVKRLYEDTGSAQGRAALELVRQSLRDDLPLHAGTSLDFYLSFQGEDAVGGPFQQVVEKPGDGSEPKWTTTPFEYHPEYAGSYAMRTRCFLGASCDSQSIDRP